MSSPCFYLLPRPPGIPVLKLKNSPPAQRKIPENSRCLSSLIITVSAIYQHALYGLSRVVFMGRDIMIGYIVRLASIQSTANILTVKLVHGRNGYAVMT